MHLSSMIRSQKTTEYYFFTLNYREILIYFLSTLFNLPNHHHQAIIMRISSAFSIQPIPATVVGRAGSTVLYPFL